MENQEHSANTGHRDKKGRYPVEKPDIGVDRKECYGEILSARGVTSGTHEISSERRQTITIAEHEDKIIWRRPYTGIILLSMH